MVDNGVLTDGFDVGRTATWEGLALNRRGLNRWQAGAGALATASAVTAALATPAIAAPGNTASPRPFAAGPARTVTLVTGDQVTLFPVANGTTDYTIRPAAGSVGFESYVGTGGDRYVVPAAAAPYLGTTLDPSLFDVSALAKSGDDTTIPLRMAVAPDATVAAPAGVTLTSTDTRTATGYVTAADAPAFGAALRKRIGADVTAGRRAGTSPLFGGVTGVSVANAPQPPATVQPHFALRILQVDVTDLTGQPIQAATVQVTNTDSVTKGILDVPVVDGIGRVAVPAGNYSASSYFFDFDGSGDITAMHQVVVSDFTVADSSTASSVAVDERTATAKVDVTSPKPAVASVVTTDFVRLDSTGAGSMTSNANFDVSTVPMYESPAAKPAVGSLHYVVEWSGDAPDASDNYRVDLAFASDDIPADETFAGRLDQVATQRDALHTDPASGTTQATLLSGPVDPIIEATGFIGVFGDPATTPGVFTDYLGTGDAGEWAQTYQTSTGVALDADPHLYPAQHTSDVDWGKGPVTAGLGQWTGPHSCDACSAGDTLSLTVPYYRDTEPDHTSEPFSLAAVHYTLYQGDTVLSDSDSSDSATVTVPRTPATYRGVLDVDQSGVPGVSQAVRTHTEETVQYSPTATNAPLPGSDQCDGQTATTPCEILGGLTLDYHLHGTDLTNTTSSPTQVLGLQVGHVTYDGVGVTSPITSVTVSVSFDEGTAWHQIPAPGVRGDYTATWQNSRGAAGTSPWLKVTATDAAGDAITQTVSNAYTIADTIR
jgi:hypothetical protein